MVWYSHLLRNFPQFIVIHTVKGFGIVNKAEIDVFLELSCFFDDSADVGNLICGSLVAQRLKHLPVMQETWVPSLGQEDPLEKEMATHSRILAWRIPWTEEPGGLQSTRLQRVRHDRAAEKQQQQSYIWKIQTGSQLTGSRCCLCAK